MPATYEPIATISYTGTSSYTFSSIPQTYTDLRLVWRGVAGTTGSNMNFQLNGDTDVNYSYTWVLGNGSTASSGRQNNQTRFSLTESFAPQVNQVGLGIADIMNYTSTSVFKSVLMQCAQDQNGTGGHQPVVGLYRSTSAITSLTLVAGNFGTGNTATLYGILKA